MLTFPNHSPVLYNVENHLFIASSKVNVNSVTQHMEFHRYMVTQETTYIIPFENVRYHV